MTDVRTLFKRAFAHAPPHVIRVPAALELLGGHTEAHQGLSYSTAVDRFVEIAFVPRRDGRIELVRDRSDQRLKLWPREWVVGGVPAWAVPVAAMVAFLRARNRDIRGFSAAIVADPLAGESGVSLATSLALRVLFPFGVSATGMTGPGKRDRDGALPKLSPAESGWFAEMCRDGGEIDFVLPFLAPLTVRAGEWAQFDRMHRAVERHPFPGGVQWVLCDYGIRDAKADIRRGRFDVLARKAASQIGLKSLRSLERRELNRHRSLLTAEEFGVARFAAGECARVVAAERALWGGDVVQLGEFLSQSHRDASRAGITSPETDLLVELSRGHPACVGARFSGSGFNGTTLNLVSWTQTDSFIEAMQAGFQRQTGLELICHRLKMADGVMA